MTTLPDDTRPPRRWIKARRSNNASACVEVMIDLGGYRIQDSKNAGRGPVLTLSTAEWHQLRDIVLSPPASVLEHVRVGDLSVALHPDGRLTIQHGPDDEHTLRFTPLEVECFLDGLQGGEFDPYISWRHPAETALVSMGGCTPA